MKRTLLIIVVSALIAGNMNVFSQDLKVEVYDKVNIPKKKPIPYPEVREADVMWAKIIWRMIDLREKMNLSIYYPLEDIANRKSFIKCIYSGIKDEGLTAYTPDDDNNEFIKPFASGPEGMALIDANLGKEAKTIKVVNDSTGIEEEKNVEVGVQFDQVKQLLVKEKWFFDKQHSTMQVRIIGICPIRIFYKLDDKGNPTEDLTKKKTFWIYYPDARPLLARHEIYNRHNDAQHISYDDFFMQRRFSSYIFQESNAYNNRPILSYTLGINSLYEAERIKQYLFEFEHDLWEY